MGDQLHPFGEELFTCIVPQVVHQDVIVGDIGIRLRQSFRDILLYGCRYAGDKAVPHAGIGPLLAAPPGAPFCLLFKGIEWEVECGEECNLVVVKVVSEVCRCIVAAEQHIHRCDCRPLQL